MRTRMSSFKVFVGKNYLYVRIQTANGSDIEHQTNDSDIEMAAVGKWQATLLVHVNSYPALRFLCYTA